MAFTSGNSSSGGAGFGASDAQRLQRALLTWQHPDAALPPAVVAAVAGSKPGQALLEARRAAWQEAFRSLFLALRAGLCAAFYYATPQARNPPGSAGRTHA